MKMISSTSITSIMGVTLMSAFTSDSTPATWGMGEPPKLAAPPRCAPPPAMGSVPVEGRRPAAGQLTPRLARHHPVDHLAAGIGQLREERVEPRGEVVVEPHRRDGRH